MTDFTRARPAFLDLTLVGLLIVVGALVLRVWGSHWGLPDMLHPDEDKIVSHALGFGKGDLNPHYFGWPSLPMYVLFAVYGVYFVIGHAVGMFPNSEAFLVAYIKDPSAIYLIGRLSVALLGTATVLLTLRLATRLYGRHVGWLSALLLATNFIHVKHSHYITPDVPMTFLVLLACWYALKLLNDPRLLNYIRCGVTIGFAIAVKYPAFVAAAPFATAHLLAGAKGRARLLSWPAVVGAACIPLAFVAGTPFSVLDWHTFLIDLQHQQIQVARPIPAWERLFTVLYTVPVQSVGLTVFVLSAIGFILIARKRRPEDLVLLSFPVAFCVFLYIAKGLQYRYFIPALPVLCILAAEGAYWLVGAIASALRAPVLVSQVATVAVSLLIVARPLVQTIALDRILARPDTRTLAREWIEQHVPADAAIALENYGPKVLSISRTSLGATEGEVGLNRWNEVKAAPTEMAVYTKMAGARLGSTWGAYGRLVERVRSEANAARPKYKVFDVTPIPYVWQIRLEQGEATPDDVAKYPEYQVHFQPANVLRQAECDYVVTSTSSRTSPLLRAWLHDNAKMVWHVVRPQPPSWVGGLPTYAFHNPTIEVFHLSR